MSVIACSDIIHVAVAVICNDQRQVLLSLRADDVHQGGLWEFPGGKLEAGEHIHEALQRECYEELGLSVERSRPFIRLQHTYRDCQVLLDVHKVESYRGEPYGKEGQALEWVDVDHLPQRCMPAANRSIVNALLLPTEYLITPDMSMIKDTFLQQLQRHLQAGISLVQLRQTQLSSREYLLLAREVQDLARQYDARLLLNHTLETFRQCASAGLHLNSKRLMALSARPVSKDILFSASCHNLAEVRQANKVGVDFIVIAPVMATLTHPGFVALGWQGFQQLANVAVMPAYALGGLGPEDKNSAFKQGAQGIAAIRSLWETGS